MGIALLRVVDMCQVIDQDIGQLSGGRRHCNGEVDLAETPIARREDCFVHLHKTNSQLVPSIARGIHVDPDAGHVKGVGTLTGDSSGF